MVACWSSHENSIGGGNHVDGCVRDTNVGYSRYQTSPVIQGSHSHGRELILWKCGNALGTWKRSTSGTWSVTALSCLVGRGTHAGGETEVHPILHQ